MQFIKDEILKTKDANGNPMNDDTLNFFLKEIEKLGTKNINKHKDELLKLVKFDEIYLTISNNVKTYKLKDLILVRLENFYNEFINQDYEEITGGGIDMISEVIKLEGKNKESNWIKWKDVKDLSEPKPKPKTKKKRKPKSKITPKVKGKTKSKTKTKTKKKRTVRIKDISNSKPCKDNVEFNEANKEPLREDKSFLGWLYQINNKSSKKSSIPSKKERERMLHEYMNMKETNLFLKISD